MFIFSFHTTFEQKKIEKRNILTHARYDDSNKESVTSNILLNITISCVCFGSSSVIDEKILWSKDFYWRFNDT